MSPSARPSSQAAMLWSLARRFLKFGTVGGSGMLVNLGVLFLAYEYLFHSVTLPEMRLNASLAVAIFFSTLNNFLWNRAWTWRDRGHHHRSWLVQFGQYAISCGVSITLQVVFTNMLIVLLHFPYLIANAQAIVLCSVLNFAANDRWTFRQRKDTQHPQHLAEK